MQTEIHDSFRALPGIDEADRILRTCVHCGFCNATCPTYLELGDERDGPRGRIYLIKQLLEGGPASRRTQVHLDRCLTCRNCETTCPSGVEYGKLVDFGRELVERKVPRPRRERLARWLLKHIVPHRRRFGALLWIGQALRPIMPAGLRNKIPPKPPRRAWPERRHARTMLALQGCAQAAATPSTTVIAARVLDTLGIELRVVPEAGCCGALSYHLSDHAQGLAFMRRNIDAWWPAVEAGAEAIVTTASGCGVTVKDYGRMLGDDPDYAAKAQRVSELAKDVVEVLLAEDLDKLTPTRLGSKVAFHCPCTLQHGQRLGGTVDTVLKRLGYTLLPVADAHLCCGSAGSYSILQPALSKRLKAKRLAALTAHDPDIVVTANVGCQLHLRSDNGPPVGHWLELLD